MHRNGLTDNNRSEVVRRIFRAYNAVSKSINPSQMLKMNLTSSQVKVLICFSEKDSFTMTELSRLHGVSVSTMTIMVDRFIQSGLLMRCKDNADRRIVRVKLTAKGRKTLAHLMEVRKGELEKFLDELTAREIHTFVHSIETVAAYLSKAKEKILEK